MDCHIVNVNGCDIDSWPFYYFGDKVRKNENDFRLMKFRCIRCGFQDIEINEIEPHADGINFRSVGQPAKPKKDIETTFYVTGLLFCRRCNHRFHVKILDQGPRNTNLYFNNMLT
jgi:DNA-directed RNA polymerase subunit RPC12/RpoP